ncbi:hypothetical protein BDV96DRAFT_240024 [Lophiotrema nucula]|uniref:Uncharacterized protein n=1 Tax=Lophiotrema nucula TaxID=690887 RepID=A0A6A5YPY4_9PLEO|nr:hypothetical protein BDV96DRAFT_240024 [Lophiotrema nucula]
MWIEKCVRVLDTWPMSSLATHGLKLITSLLTERNKKLETTRPGTAPAPPATETGQAQSFPDNIGPAALAHQSSNPPQTSATLELNPILSQEPWGPMADIDLVGFEDLVDTLPMEAGLDNNLFFENRAFRTRSLTFSQADGSRWTFASNTIRPTLKMFESVHHGDSGKTNNDRNEDDHVTMSICSIWGVPLHPPLRKFGRRVAVRKRCIGNVLLEKLAKRPPVSLTLQSNNRSFGTKPLTKAQCSR